MSSYQLNDRKNKGSGLREEKPESLLIERRDRSGKNKRMPVTRRFVLQLGLLLWIAGNVTAQAPADHKATIEAKNLYRNLWQLSQSHTLFGHQDDLAYGVGWKNIQGASDIKTVVNDYPAVYGWDLGHLELDSSRNLDGIPFSKMKEYIRGGYEREAVITISWHLRNPVNSRSAWDTTAGSVAAILPGAAYHDVYKSWLDRVADFMNDLKDKKGRPIPVLFRPFHELTGHWFWWCKNVCTPEEFKSLWRFTVQYLREQKGLHQLLFVYNTAEFKDAADFLQYYPGDDVVDMLSFDMYQHGGNDKRAEFTKEAHRRLTIIAELAKEKKKLMSFAETGYEAIPDVSWWTEVLLPALRNLPVAYVLVWRNHGYMPHQNKMHYYAPYKGQASAADFIKFYNDPQMIFERKLREKHIYRH